MSGQDWKVNIIVDGVSPNATNVNMIFIVKELMSENTYLHAIKELSRIHIPSKSKSLCLPNKKNWTKNSQCEEPDQNNYLRIKLFTYVHVNSKELHL